MILVVADDLTGAAELGGLALQFNLQAEVALEFDATSTADLLIISTDTRSVSREQAISIVRNVTQNCAKLAPQLLFKKVDSVLRGHITAEITEQMRVLGLKRSLLVPANPALGRTIQNGVYLINGTPIDQTGFNKDPEFPIIDSKVTEILISDAVKVAKLQEELPTAGIIVAEVWREEDLKEWTYKVDDSFLVAGGSGFFSALLRQMKLAKSERLTAAEFSGNRLYVSGTAFNKSVAMVVSLSSSEGFVHYIPASLMEADKFEETELLAFVEGVVAQIKNKAAAFIAIDPADRSAKDISALELRKRSAGIVKRVFDEIEINELIIEGGSTASAIFNELDIKALLPTNEYAPGVIRCRVKDRPSLSVTLKPGSYDWPNEILNFQN